MSFAGIVFTSPQFGKMVAELATSIFVQPFQFSRFNGLGLIAAGGTLLMAFAGCGGGGTGASVPTSTPTGRPVATSVSGACTSASYTPNYYGLPEPESDDTSTNVYNFWTHFPITVYVPGDANSSYRTATLAGFNQWVNTSEGRVTYQLVSDPAAADLVVSYSAQEPGSSTLGLTTVTYETDTHNIVSATMELFFYTAAQNGNARALNQSIAAHEFGHALGISPHSPYTDDLMYPFLQKPREEVSQRDFNTLRTIYCDNFSTRATAGRKNTGPTKTITIRN